jgi:FixJ family two-component response regulator
LVDRDPDHRRQVIELVQSHGWEALVCETLDDFHQCVDAARPGCVLLDSGATHEDAQQLRDAVRGADLSVVLLASEPAQLPTVQWIAGRDVAVLGKPVASHSLRHCLEDVLLRSAAEAERRRWLSEVESRFRALAPQDREVLRLVLEGQKNATIAKRLAVSLRTVENRRRRCFHVMQANSLTDLTRMVVLYEHGVSPSVEVHGRWCSLPFEGSRS